MVCVRVQERGGYFLFGVFFQALSVCMLFLDEVNLVGKENLCPFA